MEIRLLDAPVLDRALLHEQARQAVDERARHLALDLRRVDSVARIGGGHDAVHLHLVAVLHRDLARRGDEARGRSRTDVIQDFQRDVIEARGLEIGADLGRSPARLSLRFEPSRARKKKSREAFASRLFFYGGPERVRTSDLRIRSATL